MNDASFASRIARLERTARCDRVLALGALAIALATAQAPSAPARFQVSDARGSAALSAQGLAVSDAGKTVRFAAGLDRDGYPALDFYDGGGVLRQSMYLLSGSPLLRQFDPDAMTRADLSLDGPAENGALTIRGTAQLPRAVVSGSSRGWPEVDFYGSEGGVRAALAGGDDGPSLVMKDRAATTRLVLGAYPSGKFGIDVRNRSGAVVWSKP